MSGNAQNLNDPACFAQGVASYNRCVDSAQKSSLYGALLIGGGVVVGGLLLTIAALTPDTVTTPEETAKLADGYNKNLVKRLNAVAEPKVSIAPVFGPGGGGLAARFTFYCAAQRATRAPSLPAAPPSAGGCLAPGTPRLRCSRARAPQSAASGAARPGREPGRAAPARRCSPGG